MIDLINPSELSEMAAVGTNSYYEVRKFYDVNPKIIEYARIQILAGISLCGIGVFFPAATPFTTSLGGTMITEGMCDIAFEIFNSNGDGQFNEDAYFKAKLFSYGISLASMGINALMESPKILNKAK